MRRAFLLAVVLLALGASGAGAQPVPCSQGCKIHLRADGQVKRWQSRFHSSWVGAHATNVGVMVEGHWLTGYQLIGCCVAELSGQGIALRVNSKGGRFRLTWVSWQRPTPLIFYVRF